MYAFLKFGIILVENYGNPYCAYKYHYLLLCRPFQNVSPECKGAC